MARFTTLYSGSSGNAGIIEENGKYIIVDMGLSCRATTNALMSIGLNVDDMLAILITHEHSDHIQGLNVFLKHNPRPVYSSLATIHALCEHESIPLESELIAVDNRTEEIGGFTVHGFSTSHDSAGCCGFFVQTPSGAKMSIATDLGVISEENYRHFNNSHLVALEANYDSYMLKTGSYPPYLKRRIAGEHGHLSNTEAALAAAGLVENGVCKIAFCHLSKENNRPELVSKALEESFFKNGIQLPDNAVMQIQKRHEPSEWIEF